jgi:hypothetical protein
MANNTPSTDSEPLYGMESSEQRSWDVLENSIEIYRDRLDALRRSRPNDPTIADTARDVTKIIYQPIHTFQKLSWYRPQRRSALRL